MIRRSVLLRCAPARAFELFTEHASTWWPPERRHTGDPGSAVLMEPAGRFWERSGDGREVELGRVRRWDAPQQLVLDFYPGTDAEHPTEVVITFTAAAEGGTQVVVEHRHTAASEELWEQRFPAFGRSWDVVLAALQAHADADP